MSFLSLVDWLSSYDQQLFETLDDGYDEEYDDDYGRTVMRLSMMKTHYCLAVVGPNPIDDQNVARILGHHGHMVHPI